MAVEGRGTTTFLLVNGISVDRSIKLGEGINLLPAKCSPQPDDLISATKSEVDLGIAIIFLRQVSSQLRIDASDAKALAIKAWNSQWDLLLLGAFCLCGVSCNLQSDKPAEEFGSGSTLNITNYHLCDLSGQVHKINEIEAQWLEKYVPTGRKLLEEPRFQNAIHCLCSFRWHPHPRVQLAILWSGIEGIFNIDSELVFRLSIYISRYLSPENNDEKIRLFSLVKQLYKQRSRAVHGSEMKNEENKKAVEETAFLLRNLVKQIVMQGLPNIENLAP